MKNVINNLQRIKSAKETCTYNYIEPKVVQMSSHNSPKGLEVAYYRIFGEAVDRNTTK